MPAGINNIMESIKDGTAQKPEILAPAGDTDCFLAALAAGADGIYSGLKNFSARMEAENFGLAELARLTELAHSSSCRVYVALNNMIRQRELGQAYRLICRLARQVHPDGLIIQDPGVIDLARQAGFEGVIAFSTLANVCNPVGLAQARALGAERVILPRELSLDEIRQMGDACPEGLELECFVHGALCYCVSGRCYWSSYMGGKSGLRGRCVQPCRRLYAKKSAQKCRQQNSPQPEHGARFFSCQDFELLPVARQLLLGVPHIASWKIEGRKKGPHYVFHTVTAYKILRDFAGDAGKRKMAQQILDMALGRPGVRARFLPQKKYQPMAPHAQTSSGLLAGKINILQNASIAIKPHLELLPGDLLRIGVEDEKWHSTLPVTRRVPKGALMPLNLARHKTPQKGTPVYLIDRRETELKNLLKAWRKRLDAIPAVHIQDVSGIPILPAPHLPARRPSMLVGPGLSPGKYAGPSPLGKGVWQGIWLGQKCAAISPTMYGRIYFWLPPAIWPENELSYARLIDRLWRAGARHFVCNAPWQRGYFPESLPHDADIVAGPFCNLANTLALAEISRLGFGAAFASVELAGDELVALARESPLPLGLILGGAWPVGISRFGLAAGIEARTPFFSPKGEGFWSLDRAGLTWIYPAWEINLADKKAELGDFSFFAWIIEKAPEAMPKVSRPGLFNWEGNLI